MDPLQELLMAVDDAQDSAEKLDNRRSQRLTARKRLAGMIESELSRPKLSKGRKETESYTGAVRDRMDLGGSKSNGIWSNMAQKYAMERMGAMESSKLAAQSDMAGRAFPATSPLLPSLPSILRSLSDSPASTNSAFSSLASSSSPFIGINATRSLPEAAFANTTNAPSLPNLFLYSGDPLAVLRSASLISTSSPMTYPFFSPTPPSLFGLNDLSNSVAAPLSASAFSEPQASIFTPSQAERILSLMPSLSAVRGPTSSLPLPDLSGSKMSPHGSRFLPTFSPTFPLPRASPEDSHSQPSSSSPGTPRSADDDSSTTVHDSHCSPSRLSPASPANNAVPHPGAGVPLMFGLHHGYSMPSEGLSVSHTAKHGTSSPAAPSSPGASASSSNMNVASSYDSHSSPALQPGCGRYAEYIHDLKTVCAQCAASGRLKSKKKPLVDSLILLAYFGDGIKRDPHGLEYIIEDSNVARELMNIISSNIRPPSRGTNNSYDNWKRAMGKSFRKCGHSFTPKDEDTAKYARHVEEHIARIHQRGTRRQQAAGE